MAKAKSGCFLGIDGGGSKTVAAVLDHTGKVLGRSVGAPSELYRFGDIAFERIALTAQVALGQAGVSLADLSGTAFSLAGADWPEDYAWAEGSLRACGFKNFVIVNDAIGALHASLDRGPGIVIACGTGAAIGGRNAAEETWYSGHWQESGGAMSIARDALRQVYRAELKLDSPTVLTDMALNHFGQPSVENLLHSLTRRVPKTAVDTGGFAASVLVAAEQGDEAALRVVAEQARVLAEYTVATAYRLDLMKVRVPVFLTGGVFDGPSRILCKAIGDKLDSAGLQASLRKAEVEPVVGALALARRQGRL